MKKLLALLLTIIITFSLAACGGSKENGSTPKDKSELTKITFALDWTPNTNHTGLYAAKKLGYFEKAGFDVDIVYIEDSTTASLCSTGSAQFGIEAQDTLAAAYTGETPLDITAVATILQHNTSGIISRKGDSITSPKGLVGKTYSTWNSPIELAMLKQLVEKDGGNFDDVKLIPNNITDEPGALKANQTDAIWVFYGWGGINAKVQGFDFDFFFFKDIDPVFDYYTPIIIANNEFLKNEPDKAKAFLGAVKQGYEYAAENPAEAAQILIESDNTGSLSDAQELVKQSQEWISKQYIADAKSWGYIDPARWDSFYDWLGEKNLTEKALPHGTGYTNDYLE